MKCWHCESDLIWGGDHDIDDNEPEDNSEGIVTNLSCSNKECNTHVEVYHYFDDKEKPTKHFADGFHSGDWESD